MANFFLGLGIGVGIGLLFAPKSGEETREALLNRAGEGKDFLKKQAEGLRETATEFADKSKDVINRTASDFVDKSKDVINRQRDSLSDAIEAGKQAYRENVEPEFPSGQPV